MKNKNMLIIIVAALVLVGGLYYITTRDNEKTPEISETPEIPQAPETPEYPDIVAGQLAPDFTLKNLAGEEVSLSDYRGKFVMINFWATWCKWCDVEMPDIQKLSSENDDLVVLAVDVEEDIKVVEEYIKKGGYDFEVVLDSHGEIKKTYLVDGLPNSYFVDKEGILLGKVGGAINYVQMNEILEGIRTGQ